MHDEPTEGSALLSTYNLHHSKPNKAKSKNYLRSYTRSLIPPIFTWLPQYKDELAKNIKGDIIAGFTVGVMVIPQGI